MKKINTRVWISILTLLLGTMSMFANGKKDYYSRGVAHSVPSGKGSVYVAAPSGGTNGSWSTTTSTANRQENVKNAPNHTYTFTASNADPVGYTWTGWYDNLTNATTGSSTGKQNSGDRTCTGTVTANENKNSPATVDLYARWMPNTYTIVFHGNGETSGSMSNMSMVYDEAKTLTNIGFAKVYIVYYNADGGTTASTTDANTKVTYSFDGWEDRGSIIYNGTTYAYTTFDAPYYANTYVDLMNAFGYNKYNLIQHYVDNGNSEGRSCKGGTPGLYPNNATVNNLSTVSGATVDLYAHWSASTNYVVLPAATKDGAVLEGWYNGDVNVSDNKVGDPGDHYTPTGSVTLKAKWINKYDFEITGGNYTINNEAWTKTNAFTFVRADEANMTTTIQNPDVISYDRQSNTITAKKIGTSKITFTQNTSSTVKNGSLAWTITVDSVANNLTVSGTSFTDKYVDDEITAIRSNQNSNGTITATSSNQTLAHYDIANNKIVIPNSDSQTLPLEEVTITISQAPTAKYKAKKHTITLNVKKYEPTMSVSATSLELEQAATLTTTNTTQAMQVAIDPAEGILSYANGSFTAVGVGNATVTVTQPENRTTAYKQEVFNFQVSKKTPSLTVKMNGTARTSLSVTRGNTVAVTFDKTSDANVVVKPVSGTQYASYVNGTMTAGAAGTATYCASLAETETYQAKSVNFSLTVTSDGTHVPYSNTDGFTLGSANGFDWTPASKTIQITGIPDKLSFNYAYHYTDVSIFGYHLGDPSLKCPDYIKRVVDESKQGNSNVYLLYVEESADNSHWNRIWDNSTVSGSDNYTPSGNIQLQKTTRYIRFHHSCNFSNTYKNIQVTELKYVEDPVPAPIDFGSAVINSGEVSKTTLVNWCNVAPLKVSCDNPRFTVSPLSFGNFEDYGSQTLTVSYTHGTEVGEQEADITISNGDNTYTKIIHVTAETTKRPQTITWNSTLASTGYAMNVGEQYPDETITPIATATNGGTITYTSDNSSVIEVINNTELKAKAIGSANITAYQDGDDEYQSVSNQKNFTVTLLQKQSITWNQNLYGLLTTSEPTTLTATATSGGEISYQSHDEDVVVVNGDELVVVGPGETYITATQTGFTDANGVEWLAVSQDNYVIVRDPASQCNGLALSQGSLTLNSGKLSQDYILSGIPAVLSFTAKHGTKQGIWGTAPSYSSLIVEQYAYLNNLWDWYSVYNQVVGTSDTQSGNIALDETATKIRFRTSETGTDHTISNIRVTRPKFMRSDITAINEDIESNALWEQNITISHSNIDIMTVTTKQHLLIVSASTLGAGCNAFGDDAFTVSFTPTDKSVEYKDTIVITDAKAEPTTIEIPVRLYSVGLNQSINGFVLPETAVTTDAIPAFEATATSGLTVSYRTSDETIARIIHDNELEILSSGTVEVIAYQGGSARYNPAEVRKSIEISKVTPQISTPPTIGTVRYLDVLIDGLFSEGLATVTYHGTPNTQVEGTFKWTIANTQVTNNAGSSYEYSVTFMPTKTGMYNSKVFTMLVPVTRAISALTMNTGNVNVTIEGINSSSLDLSTLIASQTGDGEISYAVTSANASSATISGSTFSAIACGNYTVRATKAQTTNYESTYTDFTVTVNRLTPTIVFDNTDNPEYIYSGDVIEKPAYRMYNGHEIDRAVSYVSSDPSITGAIHVNGTTLTARDVTAPEGSAVTVTITASTTPDALYNAASETATHDYAVRAKRSPVFTMDTYVNTDASKTLNIGEQAIITYDENTNEFLTVGTASEHSYVSYNHEPANHRVIVTAVKGTVVGDGVQEIIVNQPGNDYLFPRKITYTFTVRKNVSALSLDGLTTTMNVEDTVAAPYTGLANTEASVQFSCSPEGSMKMENGKLIAMQAGSNTVTFSQPATEYWTGISDSKTITVSKKNPNLTTELQNRHAWYSIIEHPFKSLNTEKELQITSSNESLAKYIAEEDKIYVYGTSGNVTFTVNQDANYKYNAVVNYQKTFTIFQPNNRLQMDLTEKNFSDYNGGGTGGVNWSNGGVEVGNGGGFNWDDKYVILKFVGIPDVLSFDFQTTAGIAASGIDWYFGQSADGSNWITLKTDVSQLLGGVTSGSESFHLNPDTRYVKLSYSGNFNGRFKNVRITERKEIVPQSASMDFGQGFNGNDPTTRTINVDWYNVKPCTVTITGADADKFILDAGSATINSLLDNYGTAELTVSYKHETNSTTSHTANLHIQDVDGNYADIALTGQTTPAPQDIVWRNDLTPMPLNGVFPNAAMVGSNQPLTLTSDHTEIVRVDENNTLVGVAAGTARVTAVAAGSNKWAETTSYIDIEVTTKNVQFITWNDNLSNRKRQDGQTVNITLTATSSVGLPITYELDEAAQTFASISGNVLTLTDWGSGQVIAHQVGNEDYVAVQAVKSLVSRNPAAGCKPLVGEYKSEYTLHTVAEKVIDLSGEPGYIEFDAKCDWDALYGLWVEEYYDGYWHEEAVAQINRLGDNNITSSYSHFGPFNLTRRTTAVKILTRTGATMTRTFKNVEVTLAKYLELADNRMNFSQVDKGSTKTQSFYINYSNLTGVLDVEMENTTNTQFEVLTTTAGEDCGDVAQNKQIQIRFTGSTLGTEENAILVHNNDQSLRIPVSATVVLPSQTITWEPELDVLTTDEVVLSATATSELPVSFTSGDIEIAEVVYKGGVYSLDIKKYGDVAITAHQAGNENWSAATDKTLTYHISRVVPEVETWPTAQITLPNTLAAATLTGGEAPDGIPGTFHWEDESLTVTRQAHTFNVVFEPTNTDYYEPVSHPLEIEILKTPQTITWNRAAESEESCAATIILDATASSGLPVTYASSDETTAYIVDAVINEVPVKKLYVLKGGDVTITATQSGDDTYDVAPSVAKTITLVRVIPTIETLPTATDMYVHHFLSNSTPEGGVVKAGENTVTGVFNWQDGSEVMDVPGTNQRTVVFHPYNSDYYQTASAVIDVEVKRFAPTITSTITTEPAVYGTPMSDIDYQGSVTAIDGTDPARPEITGTWTWKLDPTVRLGVDDEVTQMIFHPDHTEWYDDKEFDVNIKILLNNDFTPTATAEIVYGQTLSEAEFVSTTHNPLDNSEILNGNFQLGYGLNPNACYAEGEHTITIAFQVTSNNNFSHAWKEGTATLTVLPGLIYNGTDGVWNDGNNWIGGVPDGDDRVTIDANVDVVGNVTVTALTINAGNTVTVKSGATLTIGSYNSFNRETYGNIHVEEGGKLILTSGRVGVNNLYLDASLGNRSLNISANSGQIRNPELIDVNGDAYFDLELEPNQCSPGWYDFTVPFPVDNRTGISRFQNGVWRNDLCTEQHYAIMTYHEEIRAEGQYGWKKYYGIMQPGICYTISVNNVANLYRFRKAANATITTPSEVAMTATDGAGGSVHKGWNGIGNGTLTHTHVSSQYVSKVQVYDHATNSYSILDNFGTVDLPVGTAIFVQTSQASNMLFTDVNTIVAEAPMRAQGRTLDEYLLAFGLENDAVNVDRLYLSASEDAENVYEIGHDLSKFEVSTKVAQIWADAYGQKLCDVEAPLAADQAIIPISLYAAQTGTYTLNVVRGPQDASLYLMYNGAVIWNLSQSAYTFDLTRGTNSAYSLLLTAEAPAISTGSDAISGEKTQQVEKILLNGQLYILRDGQMYDATGKKVK